MPRLLLLLNPGNTSRNYLIGLARGAQRLGLLAGTVELGDLWKQIQSAGQNAQDVRRAVAAQVAAYCRRESITHVVSYIHNGVFDFGLQVGVDGSPAPLFPSLGIRHILLWTDHPNWAMGASALDPHIARILNNPLHNHIVKSRSAADELRTVCGWQNVFSMPMAEDYELLQPARGVQPVHDAVVILSDAAPPPHATDPFLAEDDPDPISLMQAMRPVSMRAWSAFLTSATNDLALRDQAHALAQAWLDAKLQHPLLSMYRLSERLEAQHSDVIAWLRSDARRWYEGVAALNAVTAWRRSFWLSWLGRRVNLGVYGSDPAKLGLPPREVSSDSLWVNYDQQPSIYALGHCAININAPHDEEGLTHKPFQIAACGRPLVHHATVGLERCFEPGEEFMVFERGPELLEAVRQCSTESAARDGLADAALRRARMEHTWDNRLQSILAEGELSQDAESHLQSAA